MGTIGIVAIVAALVGVKTYNHLPLLGYFWWLTASVVLLMIFFVMTSVVYGYHCELSMGSDMQMQRIGSSYYCGWTSAMWFFGILCVVTIAAYCAHMVWHWMNFLHHYEESHHVLEHEDPAIRKHRSNSGKPWLNRRTWAPYGEVVPP